MAGAIRTSVQNKAYDEGWERAFGQGKHTFDDMMEHVRAVVEEDVAAHAQWHKEHPDEEHVSAEEALNTFDEVVECAYCHRTDLRAGQECACLARAPGSAAASGCRRCGLPAQLGSDFCSGCEYDRARPRRDREARRAGLLRG